MKSPFRGFLTRLVPAGRTQSVQSPFCLPLLPSVGFLRMRQYPLGGVPVPPVNDH